MPEEYRSRNARKDTNHAKRSSYPKKLGKQLLITALLASALFVTKGASPELFERVEARIRSELDRKIDTEKISDAISGFFTIPKSPEADDALIKDDGTSQKDYGNGEGTDENKNSENTESNEVNESTNPSDV